MEKHSAREQQSKWYYSLNRNDNNTLLRKVSDRSISAGRFTLSKKSKSGNSRKASSKTTGPLKERFASPVEKAGIMASNGIRNEDIKMHRLFTARPMGDKGIRIKQGSIVQHVMATPVKDMTGRDYLFVAATEADKKNYAGFFAALTKYRNNVDTMYKMEMKAMTDIVSPSYKERVQTFIDLYRNDPVKIATQLAEFNKRNYADQFKESTEELVKKYSHMSVRQLKKMGYYTYANSWFDPEAGTLKDMREVLEKKGYNAIIDDNDKRSFIQSEAPLIVFNVMDNLGDTKISVLTTGETRRNMIDWQHMKHSEGGDTIPYYIQHHGIKGQKWGERRYQNADGTWTNIGLERRRTEERRATIRQTKQMANEYIRNERRARRAEVLKGPSEAAGRALKAGKDGKASPAEKITRSSSDIVSTVQRYNQRKASEARKSTEDLSQYTNAELQEMISRLRLETQFRDLSQKDVKDGYDYVNDFLDLAGTVVTVAGGVAGIATAIHTIRKG